MGPYEQALADNEKLTCDLAEAHDVIRSMLRVLHRTDVSKKGVADRARRCIGLLPGEPVRAIK